MRSHPHWDGISDSIGCPVHTSVWLIRQSFCFQVKSSGLEMACSHNIPCHLPYWNSMPWFFVPCAFVMRFAPPSQGESFSWQNVTVVQIPCVAIEPCARSLKATLNSIWRKVACSDQWEEATHPRSSKNPVKCFHRSYSSRVPFDLLLGWLPRHRYHRQIITS